MVALPTSVAIARPPAIVDAAALSLDHPTVTTSATPETANGTRTSSGLFCPSCLLLFKPQHLTVPSANEAQLCHAPAAIATGCPSPAIVSGVDESALAPVASCS